MGSRLHSRQHRDAGGWIIHVSPFGGDDRLLPVKEQWTKENGKMIRRLVSYKDDEVGKPEEDSGRNIRIFRRGAIQKCSSLESIWSHRDSGKIIQEPKREDEMWAATTFRGGLDLNRSKRIQYTGQKPVESVHVVNGLREFSLEWSPKPYTGDLAVLVHELIDDYVAKEAADTDDGNEEFSQELDIKRLQRFTLTKRVNHQDRLQCNEGFIYVFTKGMRKDAYLCETEGENAKKICDYPNLTIINEHYSSFHACWGKHQHLFSSSSWAQHTFSIRFWMDTNNAIHFDPPRWNPYFRQNRTREHTSALEPKDEGIVTDLRDIVYD